mmetsp:Transcript_100598/g.280222  ORF Transcript_100598/g.280222 Transcript_100598/m.280222 type:complete len:317 (-) Transcript_100598:60-1010(-)
MKGMPRTTMGPRPVSPTGIMWAQHVSVPALCPSAERSMYSSGSISNVLLAIMKPSLGNFCPAVQFICVSLANPSAFKMTPKSSWGPIISELPVSKTAWHCLLPYLLHMFIGLPSIRKSVNWNCQYPSVYTGTQVMGPAILSWRTPPKVISASSWMSCPRYTANTGIFMLGVEFAASTPKMLNSGASLTDWPRPTMPSHSASLKGLFDSSVISTKSAVAQKLFSPPRHTLSRTYWPIASPIAKLTTIVSRSVSSLAGVSGSSAQPMGTAVELSFAWKRLCFSQAALSHLTEGTIRWPLPVSKITVKVCGGVPTITLP